LKQEQSIKNLQSDLLIKGEYNEALKSMSEQIAQNKRDSALQIGSLQNQLRQQKDEHEKATLRQQILQLQKHETERNRQLRDLQKTVQAQEKAAAARKPVAPPPPDPSVQAKEQFLEHGRLREVTAPQAGSTGDLRKKMVRAKRKFHAEPAGGGAPQGFETGAQPRKPPPPALTPAEEAQMRQAAAVRAPGGGRQRRTTHRPPSKQKQLLKQRNSA
jgi:hypothetical protein